MDVLHQCQGAVECKAFSRQGSKDGMVWYTLFKSQKHAGHNNT